MPAKVKLSARDLGNAARAVNAVRDDDTTRFYEAFRDSLRDIGGAERLVYALATELAKGAA